MTVYGYGSADPKLLEKYDHLPPEQAIIRAWTEGEPSPRWHALAVRDVHNAMPLLARAIDRFVEVVKEQTKSAHALHDRINQQTAGIDAFATAISQSVIKLDSIGSEPIMSRTDYNNIALNAMPTLTPNAVEVVVDLEGAIDSLTKEEIVPLINNLQLIIDHLQNRLQQPTDPPSEPQP